MFPYHSVSESHDSELFGNIDVQMGVGPQVGGLIAHENFTVKMAMYVNHFTCRHVSL